MRDHGSSKKNNNYASVHIQKQTVGNFSKLLKNYCGVDLLRYRSFETSTYPAVHLGFSLACAVHLACAP